MNSKQRYKQTILFGNPDKVPLSPGEPRESTLAMWYKQGLPEGSDYFEVLCDLLGLDENPRTIRGRHKVSFKMIPEFEEKVLEHKDGHYLVQDWMGAITEISDEFDYTYIREAKDFVTRKWHKFPVETREDWEEMKKRFRPDSPGRFPKNFKDKCRELNNSNKLINVHFNGPFWQLREWCGFENLCILTIEDPAFVHEMASFWTDFASKVLEKIFKELRVDVMSLSEDMAYKAHSMISPAMTREFLVPSYKRWVSQAKENGCSIIDMDSDGFIGELIPIWIEEEINCCHPIEVAAGNDIVEFRNTFGKKMAYTGGIDKRAIAAGGQVMRDEVMRVVPPLLRDGGFIPGCDHGVPPDISWSCYVEYAKLLAQLCGWL